MGEISEIETTQEALVERLRHGDSAAAARIMQRHNQALWRVARGILQNDADAEDAVQEAYVRAFTSLSEFRGEFQPIHLAVAHRHQRSPAACQPPPPDFRFCRARRGRRGGAERAEQCGARS